MKHQSSSDTAHWRTRHHTTAVENVSWFLRGPAISLRLLAAAGMHPGSSLVDIGGGASVLADRVLEIGVPDMTVLDVADVCTASQPAVSRRPRRGGHLAGAGPAHLKAATSLHLVARPGGLPLPHRPRRPSPLPPGPRRRSQRRRILPGSPLCDLDPARVAAADLLALASPSAVQEPSQLCRLASSGLLPQLADRCGPWALGPTFEGARLMKADADVIACGLLVELKTGLGDKRADGSRRAGLDGPTLQQMLGYTLLDFSGEFAIADIGLYAARYRHFATWSLTELLQELAGGPVDLEAEGAAFQALSG